MNAIGIKDKDRVFIGVDSSPDTVYSAGLVPANMLIFYPRKAKNTAVCFLGDPIESNLVSTLDNLVEEDKLENNLLTTHYVVSHCFKVMVQDFYDSKFNDEDELFKNLSGPLFFAKDQTLIQLDGYGNCREIYTHTGIGARQDLVNSILDSIPSCYESKYRILKTFVLLSKVAQVSYPIIITDTINKNLTPYSVEESIRYIDQYELKEGIN